MKAGQQCSGRAAGLYNQLAQKTRDSQGWWRHCPPHNERQQIIATKCILYFDLEEGRHLKYAHAVKSVELNPIKALAGLSNISTRETGIPGCQRGQTHAESTIATGARGNV